MLDPSTSIGGGVGRQQQQQGDWELIRKMIVFFDRSFMYAAPTLWNALDLDIRLFPFDDEKKESRHISI